LLFSLNQTHARGDRKLNEEILPFSLLENEGRRLPLDDKLNWYSPQPTGLVSVEKPTKATGANKRKRKSSFNKETIKPVKTE